LLAFNVARILTWRIGSTSPEVHMVQHPPPMYTCRYFATSERDGTKFMSAQDVVRALVPTYPPCDSAVERAGHLDGMTDTRQWHGDLAYTNTSTIAMATFCHLFAVGGDN